MHFWVVHDCTPVLYVTIPRNELPCCVRRYQTSICYICSLIPQNNDCDGTAPSEVGCDDVQDIDALKVLDQPGVAEVADYVGKQKKTDGYRFGARFLEYNGYPHEHDTWHDPSQATRNWDLRIREPHDQGARDRYIPRQRRGRRHLDTHPGMRVSLQTTALRKAIFSSMPPGKVDRIIKERWLLSVTENMITDHHVLFSLILRMKKEKYDW